MSTTRIGASEPPLAGLPRLLPGLEALYTDVHAHPELSLQETRTSGLAADGRHTAGFDVTTGVGKTGVVGVLRNGAGRTVMLRADMRGASLARGVAGVRGPAVGGRACRMGGAVAARGGTM